ncbi:hypothetical protein J6590_031921, partial [Homalodisca vitripennis]
MHIKSTLTTTVTLSLKTVSVLKAHLKSFIEDEQVETFLPRLESTLDLLDWNASQEPCEMTLDVLHQHSVLPLKIFLQSGEEAKFTQSQLRAVRRLGHQRSLFMGQ